MRKYLRSTRGETLVETLAAVVLCTLAILLLSASVSTASRINSRNAATDKAFAEELILAEGHLGTAWTGEVTFDFQTTSSLTDKTIAAEFFGGTGSFAAYREVTVGG